jgi:hypothetical protein
MLVLDMIYVGERFKEEFNANEDKIPSLCAFTRRGRQRASAKIKPWQASKDEPETGDAKWGNAAIAELS